VPSELRTPARKQKLAFDVADILRSATREVKSIYVPTTRKTQGNALDAPVVTISRFPKIERIEQEKRPAEGSRQDAKES
jgi:hypothetical protein